MQTRPDYQNAEQMNALNADECATPTASIRDFLASITIYEDDTLWVLDKPAGLLSVDGRLLKVSLQSRLLRVNPDVKLIHRLDMDTSGLIIFAKSAAAQTHICKQFIARTPTKIYHARVLGHLVGQGSVDVPVRYEPTLKPRHIVDLNWHKNALTHYTAMQTEQYGDTMITRVSLVPITGRSHQLRVHMLHIGHGILGDPIYTDSDYPRLCLHAHRLTLMHPKHGQMTWQAKTPF